MALLRCVSLFVVLLFSFGWVQACSICAPSDAQSTLSARVAAADAVGIAHMLSDGIHVQAVRSVRGSLPQQPFAVEGLVLPTVGPLPTVVVLFNAAAGSWSSPGRLSPNRADWLASLGASEPANGLSADQAVQRAGFYAADLEHAEPLVAQAAYEEIAALPYSAMRGASQKLHTADLLHWLADARSAERHALYYLLLGLRGTASLADEISGKALRRSASDPLALLSAQLTAVLELKGVSGLPWLEQHFLQADQPDAVVQATLLALRVQSAEGGRLSQHDFVQLCKRYIKSNPQRAGFVASDLAGLNRWEFAPAFAQLLRAGQEMGFSSRYPLVFYLMRNPLPEAKVLVEGLRADGLL